MTTVRSDQAIGLDLFQQVVDLSFPAAFDWIDVQLDFNKDPGGSLYDRRAVIHIFGDETARFFAGDVAYVYLDGGGLDFTEPYSSDALVPFTTYPFFATPCFAAGGVSTPDNYTNMGFGTLTDYDTAQSSVNSERWGRVIIKSSAGDDKATFELTTYCGNSGTAPNKYTYHYKGPTL